MKFLIHRYSTGLHTKPCPQATLRRNPYNQEVKPEEPDYEINLCSIYELLSLLDGAPIVISGSATNPIITIYDQRPDS